MEGFLLGPAAADAPQLSLLPNLHLAVAHGIILEVQPFPDVLARRLRAGMPEQDLHLLNRRPTLASQ